MRTRTSLVPWLCWLVVFYAGWASIVLTGGHLRDMVEHWQIAIAMAAGSYISGATPMGGGTVGFPILVLLFDQPPVLGRDFSFAVQSVGMTSASLFIISRRKPVEWPMLRWALLGSAIGTPLGVLFVAPHVPGAVIKALFAVVWGSFGVLHLHRLPELARHEGLVPGAHRFDRRAGLSIGLAAGATVAAITGVGIDMVIYCVLVLLCQADLRIAIPTSVILMAFTSLVGTATKLATGGFEAGVLGYWMAAAPIVVLGAPLGSFVVERVGRPATLYFVSTLCILQFIWMLYDSRAALGWPGLAASLAGVGLFLLGFQALHARGLRLGRRAPAGNTRAGSA